MKTPHILLAAANVSRMHANLVHLLDGPAMLALTSEIHKNVVGLFELGRYHFEFAKQVPSADWRQRCSRMYYGAYNVQRAFRLAESGVYTTDSTDHKKIGAFPTSFPHAAVYENQLPILREDRNLSDYDHSAEESDLAITLADAETLVADLIRDVRAALASRGISV